jgi:hypothetical protein
MPTGVNCGNKGGPAMRYLALIGMLLLSGCVTADQGYVRASGRTNPERLRLALAECQGEAAATPQDSYIDAGGWVGLTGNLMVRAAQVDTITSACMARHCYVVAQPRPQ